MTTRSPVDDTRTTPDHEVIIIGGGFSGIGAAILLEQAGFGDYLMLEAGDGVGGRLALEHLPRRRGGHPGRSGLWWRRRRR